MKYFDCKLIPSFFCRYAVQCYNETILGNQSLVFHINPDRNRDGKNRHLQAKKKAMFVARNPKNK
jgi:hypothetical protein